MPAVNEITIDRLRELAATRERSGKVLSLYVNLDPSSFPTLPARATEVNAVLDEAMRAVRDEARLSHDERKALQADVERVRERLEGDLAPEGAQGLAVFASGGDGGRLEVLRLPRPVDHHVAIGDGAYLEPLAAIGPQPCWWVVLADRRRSRLLTGGPDGLTEVWSVDDETKGQHDQGGWSQARYQRSVDKEAFDHLRATAEELRARFENGTVDGILLGGPSETRPRLEEVLHPDLARLVEGTFDVEVGTARPDEVLETVRPTLDGLLAKRDGVTLERLESQLAMGDKAAAGLQDVLAALHEQRVETLLVRRGFTAAGSRCPQCGRLGVDISPACPADGVQTEPVGDVVSAAIETAILQDATVRVLDVAGLDLHGGTAALLRF
jgi:peptide chain release factor subunit 1